MTWIHVFAIFGVIFLGWSFIMTFAFVVKLIQQKYRLKHSDDTVEIQTGIHVEKRHK